jgi:hypothetical protein
MPLTDATRRWLDLPAPRPLHEAPPAARRYVAEARRLLRWLAIGVPVAFTPLVSQSLSEAAVNFSVLLLTFGLPLEAIGLRIARRNQRRVCGAVTWWRVERAEPVRISRARADGSWRPRAAEEAWIALPKQGFGARAAIEHQLRDPHTGRLRYCYALPATARVGEDIPIVHSDGHIVAFIDDNCVSLPAAVLGERRSPHVAPHDDAG